MPDDHDRNLRNLHDTLKAAGKANTYAIIPPKEAREGAEAIERVMEKARDDAMKADCPHYVADHRHINDPFW